MNNIILVGGTGRNIGKTTLAEKLIRKFSTEVPVTALKMSNIREDNKAFHGHDVSGFESKIRLEEEICMDGNKDSMRFLKAGAEKSWFIQTRDEYLTETFPEIEKILRSATCGICESNSLIRYIFPGIFILIKGESDKSRKNEILKLESRADIIINSFDENQVHYLLNLIEFKNGEFYIPNPEQIVS